MERPRPQFRPATERDIPLIRSLSDWIWHHCYKDIIPPGQIEFMLDSMYSEAELRQQLQRGVHWQILELNGNPAGYASSSWHPDTRLLELHRLYLDPSAHGQGVGQWMLAEIQTRARHLGGVGVFLRVNKNNQRALRAYERAGFRIQSAMVQDIGHGYVMDDFILHWSHA